MLSSQAASDAPLSRSDIDQAQRFIDRHLDLFGLTHLEPLQRWHESLYFISPVDDPRYGIALGRWGPRIVLVGHLWPGFTMRSNARKDILSLLRPWIGRRLREPPSQNEGHPCDPYVDANGRNHDCGTPTQSRAEVFVSPASVRYVAYGKRLDDAIEVRELLVFPLHSNYELIEPEKGDIPSAVDARTGEVVDLAAKPNEYFVEEGGVCVGWHSHPDAAHLLPSLPDHECRQEVASVMPRNAQWWKRAQQTSSPTTSGRE